METKGIAAQGCEVSITNESASNAQGVGSPSEHPWGAVDTLLGLSKQCTRCWLPIRASLGSRGHSRGG